MIGRRELAEFANSASSSNGNGQARQGPQGLVNAAYGSLTEVASSGWPLVIYLDEHLVFSGQQQFRPLRPAGAKFLGPGTLPSWLLTDDDSVLGLTPHDQSGQMLIRTGVVPSLEYLDGTDPGPVTLSVTGPG